jgi:AraC family transcriptional regulator, exoenzyme S synthesis regulatory protein ExsA
LATKSNATSAGALSFCRKEKKPSDVCYEVGFGNISHFSFALKKQYGYSLSVLLGR